MVNTLAQAPSPATRTLTWCVHLLVAGLLAVVVVRAVLDGHQRAGATAAVAVAWALLYAAGSWSPRVGASRRAVTTWLVAVTVLWLVLLALSAEAVWLAFPLYFLQLHLLPRRVGVLAVVVTAAAASVGFAGHRGSFTIAMAVGPALGAAVAIAVVWGYQALYRESEQRRQLIEELTVTRADLAAAQHHAGVLAERERLAREIHDTIAQGLSSIQLLLRAAERSSDDSGYVEQARQTAVDSLAEARRFVAALSPPGLEGTTLPDALERVCDTTASRHRLVVRFHLAGMPAPLPTLHEVALLRIAQSALSNTVHHAGATAVDVTLSYLTAAVTLSVADDGTGFDAEQLAAPDPDGGGFGLVAMRARMQSLGGVLTIESTRGRGANVTARLPLASDVEAEQVSARD